MQQVRSSVLGRQFDDHSGEAGFMATAVEHPVLRCAIAALFLSACSTPTAVAPSESSKVPATAPSTGPATRAEPSAAAAAVAAVPAVTVEPWVWEGASTSFAGETLITAHYRLNVTLREGSLKKSFPAFAEESLEHYTSALGRLPEPPKPLVSFIFGSRDQWAEYTKKRLGEDADIYLALGRGGYTMEGESVLFDLGRWDTFALAAHEGWHQYTQSTFKHALPIWLEEGLATYMEGHRWNRGEERPTFVPWRNFERFGELREAVRADELIPLDELLEGAPQKFLRRDGRSKLLTYYAQVWALAQFLAEGEDGRYRAKLEEILQDAAAGRIAGKLATSPHLPQGRQRMMSSKLGRGVILAYFNPDFAEFKARYDEFVEALTRRGAGDMIWRGENPLKSAKSDAAAAAPSKGASPGE
ncbi:MAG: hypothetical protein SGJ09_12115 [Phycisphaerae bacterium]|nr:hypothetical protein [Phycisphaerae bacterium]